MTRRLISSALLTLMASGVYASDGAPSEEAAEGTFAAKPFSPYASRSFPERPLWGETHLHTGLSLDAGAFGNILGPDDAWRFAKGEQITSSTGQPVRLSRPWLDEPWRVALLWRVLPFSRPLPVCVLQIRGVLQPFQRWQVLPIQQWLPRPVRRMSCQLAKQPTP